MDLNNLQKLLKNKLVLAVIGVTVLIILLIVISLSTGPKEKVETSVITEQLTVTPQVESTTPAPTMTVELQAAIDEAKESAQEYDNWQANLRVAYPWLRKLPAAGNKYFVYFDLNRELFIGRLYPQAGDDVETIKTNAKTKLQSLGIDTQSYQFDWTVIPK